jgi:ferredoxin-nitrite reductase
MDTQQELTEEQKQYLQGFVSGSTLVRSAQGLANFPIALDGAQVNGSHNGSQPNGAANGAPKPHAQEVFIGPDAAGMKAQSRFIAEGKKLTGQEAAKRKKHPLDQWDDMVSHCAEGKFPKGTDVLAFKYFGLFHTAPTQDAYMTRLRFPCGIVRSDQMRRVAFVAEQYAGGYAHVTTRANLQLREISAHNGVVALNEFYDAGILNKGAGADNIRNVTGSPTAGIDSQELIDVRPLCREMHYYIINNREMYGLPRKFNIAFDGGGIVHNLEDTNDIGFQAVLVGEGKAVPAGVYFRMALGGITGHQDLARDTGVLLKPEECVPVAAAVVRIFIDEGDRTDRKKARLKYVLDRLGFPAFMEKVRAYLPFEPLQFPLEECEQRPITNQLAHIDVHPQQQGGLFYVGVVLPVGRLEASQIRALGDLADKYGSGTIRLTVWQNLLISDVKEANLDALKKEIEAIGLHWNASNVRAGLVACTGAWACKFGLADTKKTALEIANHVESRLQLDTPLNIHVTGCPNSCAQHYIGDIGLLGVKIEDGDDLVDGFHIFVGGGWGAQAGIGRLVQEDVRVEDVPAAVENMLATYLDQREGRETFVRWTRRHAEDELKAMFDARLAVAA